MKQKISQYEIDTRNFLKEIVANVKICYADITEVPWDKTGGWHDMYVVRVDRNHKTWRFRFYNSIYNTEQGIRPGKYDVLACVGVYCPDDMWTFAEEFGYTITNRDEFEDVKQTHKACMKQYKNFLRLFGDVEEQFNEICS